MWISGNTLCGETDWRMDGSGGRKMAFISFIGRDLMMSWYVDWPGKRRLFFAKCVFSLFWPFFGQKKLRFRLYYSEKSTILIYRNKNICITPASDTALQFRSVVQNPSEKFYEDHRPHIGMLHSIASYPMDIRRISSRYRLRLLCWTSREPSSETRVRFCWTFIHKETHPWNKLLKSKTLHWV